MTPALQNPPAPTAESVGTFLVGVEVGPAIIRAGVFDSHCHLLGKTKITTRRERGPAAVIERIIKCIRYAVDECDYSMSQISKVGIAVSGRINSEGIVESCPELDWQGIPLQAALAAELDTTVEVSQVYELGALAIRSLEINKPVTRFAAVFLGPQIGAAVSLGGQWQDLQLLRRDTNDPDALSRNILAAVPHPVFGQFRGRDFRKALRNSENRAVRDYVTHIAKTAGICAARIHQQFAPEIIALGGGLIDEVKEEILATAQASFEQTVTGFTGTLPTLIASRLGDLAPITGAAIWANGRQTPRPALVPACTQ